MAGGNRKRQNLSAHAQKGKAQRDERIDNVRGILIILVVVGHFLLPLSEADTRLIDGLIYVIYVFHMPCFVMLSGYFSKNVYAGGRFRWGKVVQMLWLYFVYETILFFTERLAYGPTTAFPNYLRESGAPWYLMSLATWYLTVPVFQRFRNKNISGLVVAVLFVAVAFIKYIAQFGSWLCLDRTIAFLPFFYAGYFFTQPMLDKYMKSPAKRAVDILAAFFAILVFTGAKDLFLKYNLVVYGADYNRFLPSLYGRLWLIYLVWCAIAVIISLGLLGITLSRKAFIITELGKNTLQIYFLHRPLRDILMYFGFYEKIDPFNRLHVLFVVIFSAALAVALGSGYISSAFTALRTCFDSTLERYNAL